MNESYCLRPSFTLDIPLFHKRLFIQMLKNIEWDYILLYVQFIRNIKSDVGDLKIKVIYTTKST